MAESSTKTCRVTVIDGTLPTGIWQDAKMEPHLQTAPDHTTVLQELVQREPLFHRAEFGISREDFERMTAPEFWEVGASGRRCSREFCLETLEKRYQQPTEHVWEISDFHCLQIAKNSLHASTATRADGSLRMSSYPK